MDKLLLHFASQMSFLSGSAVKCMVEASEATNADKALAHLEQAVAYLKMEIDAKAGMTVKPKLSASPVVKDKESKGRGRPRKETTQAPASNTAVAQPQTITKPETVEEPALDLVAPEDNDQEFEDDFDLGEDKVVGIVSTSSSAPEVDLELA